MEIIDFEILVMFSGMLSLTLQENLYFDDS